MGLLYNIYSTMLEREDTDTKAEATDDRPENRGNTTSEEPFSLIELLINLVGKGFRDD